MSIHQLSVLHNVKKQSVKKLKKILFRTSMKKMVLYLKNTNTMVKIDSMKFNNQEFFDAILNNNLLKVKEMHHSGHRIVDYDMTQKMLNTFNRFNLSISIELIRFVVHNILEPSKGVWIDDFHPDIDSDIISVLIDKHIKFSGMLVYNIISTERLSTFLPYFVVKYSYMLEWVKTNLSAFERNGTITDENMIFIKFCKRYFMEHISDKLIFKLSLMEIYKYGKIKTFSTRSLNISESDVIDIFCSEHSFYGNKDKNKFVELLLLIKKNSTVTYKIVQIISEYSGRGGIDTTIFEIFGDILRENLKDYFYSVKPTSDLIRAFYKNRTDDTVLCNLGAFLMMTSTKVGARRKNANAFFPRTQQLFYDRITVDDIKFIIDSEKNLKQQILSDPKQVFKKIFHKLPIIKFLSEIYSDEIMYDNIIELLFLYTHRCTDDEYNKILNFIICKYPKIMTMYTFEQIFERIGYKNDNHRFLSFLKNYIKNFNTQIKLSDEISQRLIESDMLDTFNCLLKYNVIEPKNKTIANTLMNKLKTVTQHIQLKKTKK